MDKIDQGKANSWEDYYKNYEFYRKNQQHAFGDIETHHDIPSDGAYFGILEADK
jgi:hypothetical protein